MKFLIVAALAALALASSRGSWSIDRPLQAKTEYRYRYEGSVMTGLPVQNTDVTLTRIRSDVHVQMTDDRTLLLRLREIRLAASHTDEPTPSRTESLSFVPLEALEDRQIAKEHQKMLEEPVRCVYRNGMISEIQFSSDDEAWSKNIKRAVLNMLQINLDKTGRTTDNKEMHDELSEELKQNDFYSVVEKTLEGDCEVSYTIVREEQWTTVTKSINFDKCTGRPDIKYNMRFESECEDCEKQNDLVQPQTVYTYRIEKDTIKNVDVRSIYSVSLKDEPYMKTEIKARLTLEKSQPIQSQIPHPKGSERKEEMIYSNEWEEMVESFFKHGDNSKLELPFTQYETSKKIQQIRKIVEKIMEKEENKPETAHQMARLVRLVRMCSEDELKKVHSEFYKSSDEKVRKFYEHALAIAGTHNTVRQLVHLIEKRECTPIKAAQYLKAVQETPYPSEKIAEMIVRLAEKSENEPVLRQSAWLCAGSLVRGVVSENRDDVLLQENKREIKQKFIRIFMKEFQSADSTYEKILALKTLANAGIDLSIYEIQKIIVDKREELAVRIEAIDALRLLKDEMPRKVQQILMPVYKNRFEFPELRMAALVKIMHTLPEQPILAQIVFQMEREPSQQVAAFTYYMLQTLSKSTSPCHQTISKDISTLLSFTRFQPQENYYSAFLHLPLFSEELLSGASLNLASLFGKDSYIPKELSLHLNTILGGNWNKYFAQIGFSQQNLDIILEKITRKLYNLEKESTTIVRGRRVEQSLNLLKELTKKLSIKPRESNYRSSTQKPHALLYFRYKEMDFAVLPIDDQVLDEIVEKYIRNGRIEQSHLDRLFNRDHEFEMHHAAFFYEATRKMPTSIGLPLTISGKIPTVFSAEGKFQMEMLPLGVRVQLKVQPSLAATHISQMRFWTPLFEQGVKILSTVEAQTPVEIVAEATFKGELELNYAVVVPENKKTIVRAHRRPVIFIRYPKQMWQDYVETEEKTVVHPYDEQLTKDVDYTHNVWGMRVQTRGTILRNWYSFEHYAFCEQEIETIIESTSGRNELKTRIVMQPLESGRIEKMSTGYEKLFEDEFEPEDSEYSVRRTEKERREHFQKRVRDIESGEGYKQRTTIKVENNKEKIVELELRTQCDREIRYCRVSFDGRRQPMLRDERNEWTIKGEAHLALPESPRNLKEMKEQKHRELQAFFEAKWGSEKKSELSMKMQFEQDKEQNRWLQHAERKELSGMNAYDVLVKAGRLNKLNVVAEYELSHTSEAVFRRIYDLVKAYGFWSSQWESRQGQEGRVLLQLTVDPISRRYANLTVQTPNELLRMQTVRLPTRVPLVSIAHRSIRESLYTTSDKAECEVKSTRVNTFDDMIYRTPLTTCYSVVAKDCSSEPRFAVLVKKMNKNTEELKVKIIDEEGNKIELENQKDEIVIRVNNKDIRKESEWEKYGIEKISEDMIRVNLDSIEVRFDGYTVKTHMSRRYQEQQCGLCGHFDGEMENDFRMANDEETDDIEEFHRSFLVKGDECEIEEERISEKKNYKNYRKTSEYYNSEESDEEYEAPERYNEKKYERDNSEYDSNEEIEPIEKTRVVEYSHRICFSKEPVMECPRRAQNGKTQEKKMQFVCLPRQQSEARRLLRDARSGDILRLSEYPVSYVESIEVPKTCVVY